MQSIEWANHPLEPGNTYLNSLTSLTPSPVLSTHGYDPKASASKLAVTLHLRSGHLVKGSHLQRRHTEGGELALAATTRVATPVEPPRHRGLLSLMRSSCEVSEALAGRNRHLPILSTEVTPSPSKKGIRSLHIPSCALCCHREQRTRHPELLRIRR